MERKSSKKDVAKPKRTHRPWKPPVKGERRGGRKKGVPNKLTRFVKAAIQETFDRLGGVDAMLKWAKHNPEAFYTKLYIKLLPLDIQGTLNLDARVALIKRVIVDPMGDMESGKIIDEVVQRRIEHHIEQEEEEE